MKKFLLSIAILTLSITLLIGGLFAAKHQDHYDLPESRNILVMGDSHTEHSIDDSILTSAVNLSNSGEPYICTYIGLRSVLDGRNKVDTLLLGFWQHSLHSHNDKFSPAWQKRLNSKILHIRREDIADISLNPMFYFRPIFFALLDDKYSTLGKYGYNARHDLDVDVEKMQRELSEQSTTPQMIQEEGMQYRYLQKIKRLCEEHDIKLILFSPPTYHADELYQQEIFEQQLREELHGFTYVNFSDFPIPDEGFVDVGHLNYIGARIFSKHLRDKGVTSDAECIDL